MNHAPYTIDECIQVMNKLENELLDKHRTSPLEQETWPIFVKIIRSQAKCLREQPPNLNGFSSGGVGMLHLLDHETQCHHVNAMGKEWNLAYTKVCRAVFCMRNPDFKPKHDL